MKVDTDHIKDVPMYHRKTAGSIILNIDIRLGVYIDVNAPHRPYSEWECYYITLDSFELLVFTTLMEDICEVY